MSYDLWQIQKANQGRLFPVDDVKLEARSKDGDDFSTFSLDLSRLGGEAWFHQNLCVNRHDFYKAKFSGTLCVQVITLPESNQDRSASALLVDVSRQVRSSGNLGGRLISPREQTLGGFRSSTPIDAAGKSVFLSQMFPTSKDRPNELSRIEILCGG